MTDKAIRIEKGDIILIKAPTKKNPSRLIEAYVRYVTEAGGQRRLALVGANQRKYNIFEENPNIIRKLDARPTDSGFIELEKV